jgi:hypothetical protein
MHQYVDTLAGTARFRISGESWRSGLSAPLKSSRNSTRT